MKFNEIITVILSLAIIINNSIQIYGTRDNYLVPPGFTEIDNTSGDSDLSIFDKKGGVILRIDQKQAQRMLRTNVYRNVSLFDELPLRKKIKITIAGILHGMFRIIAVVIQIIALVTIILKFFGIAGLDQISLIECMYGVVFCAAICFLPILLFLPFVMKESYEADMYWALDNRSGYSLRHAAKDLLKGDIGGFLEDINSGRSTKIKRVAIFPFYKLIGGNKRPFINTFLSYLLSGLIVHNLYIFFIAGIFLSSGLIWLGFLLLSPYVFRGVFLGLKKKYQIIRYNYIHVDGYRPNIIFQRLIDSSL